MIEVGIYLLVFVLGVFVGHLIEKSNYTPIGGTNDDEKEETIINEYDDIETNEDVDENENVDN